MPDRVYLDWNATAPLRPEARDAMIAAMDAIGNPSSVHAEGRRAKAIVERARAQVAELVDCRPNEVVFTSGATEAAALAAQTRSLSCTDMEHDCVLAHQTHQIAVNALGEPQIDQIEGDILALQGANSETGHLNHNIHWAQVAWGQGKMVLVDAVQLAGRFGTGVDILGADYMLMSAHKMGGPKGVGALCLKLGLDLPAMIPGGGQEQGRRSGTENVVGIAGFGAAAEAAGRDLQAGLWDQVAELRKILEKGIAAASNQTIFVGNDAPRLQYPFLESF